MNSTVEAALATLTPTTLNKLWTGEKPAGWNVQVFDTQGNEVDIPGGVGLVLFHNPRMKTTASYGLTPGGHDGLLIHENDGGGDITVVYTFINGEVYIGLVKQNRFTQGGPVDNVPRGYREPGLNPIQNAVKEFKEEMGLELDSSVVRFFSFDAQPLNANSGTFDTTGEGEGCRFHGCQIDPKILTRNDDGSYALRPEVINQASDDDRKKEAIFGAVFRPLQTVLSTTTDMFTAAGAALLINYLSQQTTAQKSSFDTQDTDSDFDDAGQVR